MTDHRRPKRAFSLPPSRDGLDGEVLDEFRFHIEERIEQFMADGMSREQAEREVAQRFGDIEAYRAHTRAIDASTLQRRRRMERLRDVKREVQMAVRSLWRSPGFTIVAFFTLALGIGASAGIFSVLDAVVLRPLPYENAGQLVSILHPATVPGSGERTWGLSAGGYFHFAGQNRSFSSMGVYRNSGLTVTNDNQAELVQLSMSTASVFTTLSLKPAVGRLFSEADDAPTAPQVAVLSHEFFERRFGGDLRMIGRNLETSNGTFEIIGVTAPGVKLPMPGPFASSADLNGFGVDVWVPLRLNPAGPFYNNHGFVGVARLKPGVDVVSAQTDLATLFARFPEAIPNAYSTRFISSYNFRVKVEALQETVLGPRLPRTLWMLAAAVLLVLGIATANTANLYLVRLDVRRRESAIRSALGADRLQMATHFLSETLLLCGAAAVAGLALAFVGLRALKWVAPTDIPRLSTATLDLRTIGFGIGVAVFLGVLLGVLPLLRRSIDLEALRSGGRGQSASARQRVLRSGLVVGQLAMALTLLAAGGLMLRSFDQLRRVKPGFETAQVLAFDVSLPYNEYRLRSAAIVFHRELHRRLREMPGVIEVGSTSSVPLEGFGTGCSVVFRENMPYGPDEQTPCVSTPTVTPGFFEALGITADGRLPTWGDVESRTQAVVVTTALAKRLWPGENAIGKGIGSNGADSDVWYRVAGVIDDIKAEALDAPATEAVFYPATGLREDDDNGSLNDQAYLVRANGIDPLSLMPEIRNVIQSMNPRVPIIAPRLMDTVMSRSMARTTFLMILLGLSAGVALVLSAVGIHGVISYVVSQRRSEIGIRMALGASVTQMMRMVLLQSMRLAVLGAGIGVVGALVVSRVMRAMLFGVSPNDPIVLVGVIGMLFVTTLLASVVPARRAARVDPAEAMRAD